MKGFYRQEGEARKLLAIEKKRLFQARSYSFGHKGEGLSYRPILLFLGGEWKGPLRHITSLVLT